MTQTQTAAPASLARIDLSPYRPERIAVWSDYRLKDAVKAVPGARWDSDNRVWHVPLTWPSCLALRSELGRHLTMGDGLRAWAYEEKSVKDAVRGMHRVIDDGELETIELPGFDELFPYQRVAAEAIAEARAYALFDETGTGKSRSSLAGLALAQHRGETIFPLLIVAPKSMLVTWARDEVPRFFPDADVRVAAGSPTKTRDALKPGADVYVCSYDTARRYSRHASYATVKLTGDEHEPKELNALALRSLIADECHRIKNPKSKQTRALWQLGSMCEFRIGLSGSPMQDTPEDLWSLLRFVSPEEYPGKTAYVDRFLRVNYNIWGGREITGLEPVREDEFRANVETRYRRVTKDVALPFLPDKVYETRWVELPPKLRKAYDSMVKVMVAELKGGEVLAAKSNLERAGRLTQLANASGSLDAAGKFHMELPSPKIDAFLEDVAEGDYDGQQVVVFSDSRQLVDLLSEAMTKKKLTHVMITGDVTGDDRQDAIDTFQAGEAQFILITRAGGEGVTLTAASTMVRLVRSWSYIVHTQSEDRVHRIGSEKHESITYVDYITQDTVEVGQIARLNGKGERIQEVLRDDELLEMLGSK